MLRIEEVRATKENDVTVCDALLMDDGRNT